MRIGILTGGGDCPGLNAVIRAVVRSAQRDDDEIIGFRNGWRGVLEDEYVDLTPERVGGILHRGGTILGTSRDSALDHRDIVGQRFADLGLDGLIVVGGNGTLYAADQLSGRFPIVGVPKTIDNDVAGTDRTFGFDTAVQTATDALDRLHTTAESHYRNLVVEVMGRNAGWIALHAGIAGGADVILLPERPFDLDDVVRLVRARQTRRNPFSIIVVAEGAAPKDGDLVTTGRDDPLGRPLLGGIGHWLSTRLEDATGAETRTVVLGHLLRGGTPTAFDRVLASRFGEAALGAVRAKRFGTMVALHGDEIALVPLAEAVLKLVPADKLDRVEAFLG